jgi:2-polyprenyl-3-methyl-5-hydroxy-6-metoxy-1,4-benzoquinol methylase
MGNRNFVAFGGSRIRKAKKIIACIEFVTNEKVRDKKILEIGGGSGLISFKILKEGNQVTTIDLQDEFIKKSINQDGLELAFNFIIASGTKLPFKPNSFNVVICNQVIEHVQKHQHQTLIDESYTVLKSEGLFYIATPNKLWPIEPHTKLPFLSYLPKKLAENYIKLAKGILTYNISMLKYNELINILSFKFNVINLTPIIIKFPEKFYIYEEIPKLLKIFLKKVPLNVINVFNWFFPSWIIIAKKQIGDDFDNQKSPEKE